MPFGFEEPCTGANESPTSKVDVSKLIGPTSLGNKKIIKHWAEFQQIHFNFGITCSRLPTGTSTQAKGGCGRVWSVRVGSVRVNWVVEGQSGNG